MRKYRRGFIGEVSEAFGHAEAMQGGINHPDDIDSERERMQRLEREVLAQLQALIQYRHEVWLLRAAISVPPGAIGLERWISLANKAHARAEAATARAERANRK